MRRRRWKPLFLAPALAFSLAALPVGCLAVCTGCSTLTVKGNLKMNSDGTIDYAASTVPPYEVNYYRLTHLPRDLVDALIDAWERAEGEDDGG